MSPLKHSFFKNLLVLFAFTCGLTTAVGQSVSSSPYSSYGLGETYLSGLNYNTGFGTGGAALDSNLHVNMLNPAGLAGLQYATFEGSVATRRLFLKDANRTGTRKNTNLDHLVFGLPVAKRSAVSFGLMPYTGIGVNLSDTVEIASERVNFVSEDSGGTNKAFLAAGFGAGKFSFGVEGSYIFGNIERERQVSVVDDPSALNITRFSYTKISGVTVRGGVHFKTKLSTGYRDTIPDSLMRFRHKLSKRINGTRLSLSAVYEPSSLLNAENSLATYHQIPLVSANRSLVEAAPLLEGTIYSPQGGSFGMAVQKGKWTTVADVTYKQWSKFRSFEPKDTVVLNGEADLSGADSLTDSWKASFGVQLHPDATSNKFFQQGKYRIGAYYSNTGIVINGTPVNEYALTLGWGIPLRRAYANGPIPIIEASVALGERGTIENGLTRERFITARIGLTISDRWFVRRKFD